MGFRSEILEIVKADAGGIDQLAYGVDSDRLQTGTGLSQMDHAKRAGANLGKQPLKGSRGHEHSVLRQALLGPKTIPIDSFRSFAGTNSFNGLFDLLAGFRAHDGCGNLTGFETSDDIGDGLQFEVQAGSVRPASKLKVTEREILVLSAGGRFRVNLFVQSVHSHESG